MASFITLFPSKSMKWMYFHIVLIYFCIFHLILKQLPAQNDKIDVFHAYLLTNLHHECSLNKHICVIKKFIPANKKCRTSKALISTLNDLFQVTTPYSESWELLLLKPCCIAVLADLVLYRGTGRSCLALLCQPTQSRIAVMVGSVPFDTVGLDIHM